MTLLSLIVLELYLNSLNFLFGKRMTLIMTKKKKTFVLPPEEVTTVLFDLTANLATSAPDLLQMKSQYLGNLQIERVVSSQ